MKIRFLILSIAATVGAHALAESLTNPFPAGRIFPQPVGILFPSLNVAPGVNASSIPANNKGTAIQVAASPAIQSGDPSSYFGSVATTGRSFGLGASYLGVDAGGGMQHGASIGAGYSFESFSLGLGARDNNVQGGFDPGIDASLMLLALKEVTAGAVIYNLNYDAQMDLGVGVKAGSRYNVEVNLLLPPFRYMTAGYVATVSASIFVEPFGLHFRSSYHTSGSDFSHTIGLGVWMSKMLHLTAQFSTSRTATVGLTALF